LTGWIEVPVQIGNGYDRGFWGYKDDTISGIMAGAITGVWYAAGRTLSGVVDIVGCWAADPKGKKNIGIPTEAEYAWEQGERYEFSNPSFLKATLTPMGNKFIRGFQNTVGGVFEVPGQIGKGFKNRAADGGFGKGLWYFISREIDGAYELAGFAMPAPKDYVGVEFDEEKPWDAMCAACPAKAKAAPAEAVAKPKKDLWKVDAKLDLRGIRKEGAAPAPAAKPKKDLWKTDARLDFGGIKKEKAAPKQQEK
jgi:hypothetical protein